MKITNQFFRIIAFSCLSLPLFNCGAVYGMSIKPGSHSEINSSDFDSLYDFLKTVEGVTHWLADGPNFSGHSHGSQSGTYEFLQFIKTGRLHDSEGVLRYDAVLALRILCNAIEMKRDDIVKIILDANALYCEIPWMLHIYIINEARNSIKDVKPDSLSPLAVAMRIGHKKTLAILQAYLPAPAPSQVAPTGAVTQFLAKCCAYFLPAL